MYWYIKAVSFLSFLLLLVVAPSDIEKMAAECIKDISDDENDDDESLLNDPDLLKELSGLSCESPIDEDIPEKTAHVPTPVVAQKPSGIVTVLDERLQMYTSALAAAKAMNDSSKVRRYSRAVKVRRFIIFFSPGIYSKVLFSY